MRITALATWLSILVAVGAILLLIALPGPGVDRGTVDAQTGTVPVPPVDVLGRALRTGDAAVALHNLAAAADPDTVDDAQRDVLVLLRAELAPATAATPQSVTELSPIERLFATFAGADATTERGIDRRAALAASQLAGTAAAIGAAALAREFAAIGRPRARDRWLARAIAAAPTDTAVRLQAATAWIAERRLAEAAAILADAMPIAAEATQFWHLRSDLARWLGDYAAEATALDHLLAVDDDPRLAARLVEVHLARADRPAAAQAARDLATRTNLPEHWRQAAELLFAAGLADQGFAVLKQQIATSDDPQAARRQLAAVLQQDLRFDEAQRLLEEIVARGGTAPEPDDVAALESLYRRLGRRAELIHLLSAHVQRDAETPFELVHLLAAEDRHEEAGQLLAHLLASDLDSTQFFRLLPWFADANLPDLATRAAAAAANIDAGHLAFALDAMAIDGFDRTPALTVFSARFPDAAEVWQTRLDLVWGLGETDPTKALPAVRALAQERPQDRAVTTMWVTFADRYGSPDERIDARRQLAAIEPGDHRNRRQLGELLAQLGAADDAIAVLQQLLADGDRTARGALVHALGRAGRAVEVRARLDDCAADGVAALIETADILFADDVHTTALEFYLRALELDPARPHALLRAGMLLGWVNRPREALPLLERAVADPSVARCTAAFHLAEVQWALDRRDAARASYALSLAHRDDQPADQWTGAMVARCLHRTGELQAALSVYLGLLHGPTVASSTLLDVAELYVDLDDDDGVVAMLGECQRRDPHDRRLLRLQAERQLRQGDPDGARALLLRIGERHDFDGGELSTLGRIDEWAGEFGAATATYRRWVALQDVRDARGAEQRTADLLATHVGLQGSLRTIGDDSMLEAGIYGAATIDERTRIQGRIAQGEYRGRSQAVGGGLVDVVTRTPLLDLGIVHRYGTQNDQIGAGLRWHPDAVGSRSLGGWIEQHWQSDLPAWVVSLRLGGNELWNDPAAAAGLDGRTSSAVLSGYRQLGDSSWTNGELGYRVLDARAPGQERRRDGELVGNVQFGHRWTQGDIAVAEPFRAQRAPAGPDCPYLGHGPRDYGDLHVSTWVGLTIDQLLDNAALTAILPLSERIHFLYLAGRIDRRLASGLGVSLDGLVGTDLENSGTAWELAGAVTWRPEFGLELDGRLGFGDAFGRGAFDSQTMFARIEGVLRW